MGEMTATKLRQIAKNYALSELYPDRDEATVEGMTREEGDANVGVVVERPKFFSRKKFVVLTIDANGDVVLTNEYSSKQEFKEALGRATRRQRTNASGRGGSNEAAKNLASFAFGDNSILAGGSSSSSGGNSGSSSNSTKKPSKCPNCGKSRLDYGFMLWKEVGSGAYNCRNCGKTVRLGVDSTHHHEHDY